MKNSKDVSYKKGNVIIIDLSTTTPSSINPLEILHTEDIDRHLSEHIILLFNSIAEKNEGFTLTEQEMEAVGDIIREMHLNQKDLNILTVRNVMMEKTSGDLDLTKLIKLLNKFL